MSKLIIVLGRSFTKGYHTLNRPAEFKTDRQHFFGGREIPVGSWCRFFETRNFGFISFLTPDGNRHLAKE